MQIEISAIMNSPVLFIVYNRPDLTRASFEAIRAAKPPVLFVSADGPKQNDTADERNCLLTREVIDNVDWPCDVYKYYRSSNVGCKIAVVQALDWFFEHVEHGIIIEDDCVAAQNFFDFADNLLVKYRDDHTVGHISGVNFYNNKKNSHSTFSIIKYAHVWGWATWRRVWKSYTPNVSENGGIEISVIPGNLFYKLSWYQKIKKSSTGQIDTWDYQYQYNLWKQNLKSVIPSQNLVKNIGFDNRATHTKTWDPRFSDLQTSEKFFPATESNLEEAEEINRFIEKKVFGRNYIITLVKQIAMQWSKKSAPSLYQPV